MFDENIEVTVVSHKDDRMMRSDAARKHRKEMRYIKSLKARKEVKEEIELLKKHENIMKMKKKKARKNDT